MHGIIFAELKKYVDGTLGSAAWGRVLDGAGLKGRTYLPGREYPDIEALAIATTISRLTGVPVANVLEDFGEFMAPSLVGMYQPLMKPEWRTLDFLEHTEDTIHTVVRQRNPAAKPAELGGVRRDVKELSLTYTSERKMCAVARGMIRGIGRHYRERVSVTETQCMHRGAAHCQMTVRVA